MFRAMFTFDPRTVSKNVKIIINDFRLRSSISVSFPSPTQFYLALLRSYTLSSLSGYISYIIVVDENSQSLFSQPYMKTECVY